MNFKQFLRPGKGAADITPLLQNKEAFGELINQLSLLAEDLKIDKVASLEGRGFLLGSALAYSLHAGSFLFALRAS